MGRRFPRVRGDVPHNPKPMSTPNPFSPRARGCSPGVDRQFHGPEVFPACAGMFPCPAPLQRGYQGFPRVRGDVPSLAPRKPKR